MPYAYTPGNPLQMVDPLGLYSGSAQLGVDCTPDVSLWDAMKDGLVAELKSPAFWGSLAAGAACMVVSAGTAAVACGALAGAVHTAIAFEALPEDEQTVSNFWEMAAFDVAFGAIGGIGSGPARTSAVRVTENAMATSARSLESEFVSATRSSAARFEQGAARGAESACAGGACRIAGQSCFVAGTGVLLADGTTVAVEDVKVGDLVETTDPATGVESAHAVTQLFVHEDAPLFDVVIDGSTVTATPTHPFWVIGRGWVTVDQLEPGDQLLQPDDTTVTVESVTATGRTATVYNFEVEDAHDYYVKAGDHWVLVHNDCGAQPFGPAPQEFAEVQRTIQATGRAPANTRGGQTWHNRDGVLPSSDSAGGPITYQEWYVQPTTPGVRASRDRLVSGSDLSWYMTRDHYVTFTRIP